jgi:hypothetical protein
MQFTYTADDERDYSEVDGSALRAIPGHSYELSEAPQDGRWTAQSAPVAPVTPVTLPEGA